MKKRLIAFVSMLLAFVLCFALVACDGQTPTTNNPNGPEPPVGPGGDPINPPAGMSSMTVEQALNAVGKLFADEDGWKGTASYKLSTANTDELKDTVGLEKRGNRVEITIGDESLIYDMTTGYGYYKEVSGYYASQMTPGGVVDYARYLVGGALTDELTGATFYYNKETGAASFELDLAKKINDALAPLYDAYKKGKNVNALLNAYCLQYTKMSFDDLYTAVKTVVAAYKDYTVNDVLLSLKAAGLDLLAILEENGIVISKEEMEVFGPRKIKEMVAGAYVYINNMMADMTADDETSEVEGGMESMLTELLNAMFMEEYDEKTINEAFTSIEAMIEGVLAMNVKTTIDSNKEMLPNELYVMIQNGVKIEALKLNVTAVFDKDKNVTELNFTAEFKHDYKGTTEGLDVLADNNYYAEAGLKIEEYTTDIGGFEFELVEGGADISATVSYIVYSPDGQTVSAYLELGGANGIVESIDVYVGNLLEEPEMVTNANTVTFNTITSCVEFKGELIAAFFNEDTEAGYTITAVLHYEDVDLTTTVMLVYLNDDMDQLSALAQNVIGAITAPTDPDVPSIDDGDYEEIYA